MFYRRKGGISLNVHRLRVHKCPLAEMHILSYMASLKEAVLWKQNKSC